MNQRQRPTAVRLHVLGDTGVTGDLPGALHDENISQHRASKQPEPACPTRIDGYTVDFGRGATTYFLPEGDFGDLKTEHSFAVAQVFDA
jgi:hypothetical protein